MSDFRGLLSFPRELRAIEKLKVTLRLLCEGKDRRTSAVSVGLLSPRDLNRKESRPFESLVH